MHCTASTIDALNAYELKLILFRHIPADFLDIWMDLKQQRDFTVYSKISMSIADGESAFIKFC